MVKFLFMCPRRDTRDLPAQPIPRASENYFGSALTGRGGVLSEKNALPPDSGVVETSPSFPTVEIFSVEE